MMSVPGLSTNLSESRAGALSGRPSVTVVIAAYNEGASVGDVVRELLATYPDVVVVDDGSGDDTAERARAAGASVLTHLINRGQGAALQTGLCYALAHGAEIIVTFDADGQHDVADLPALIAPIVRGEVEISLGSRFLSRREHIPIVRRVVLLLAVWFMRITSRVRLSDAHNGLRAFSRRAASMLDLKLDRMAHASELVDQVAASGLPFVEVPVHVRYTAYSLKKGQKNTAALRVVFDYLMGRLIR
jgi:glycosyltransferase involved in cell wall biosynthesis